MAADPIPVNAQVLFRQIWWHCSEVSILSGHALQAMDVRILQSIPTPVADSLLARGRKNAADILSRPEALTEATRRAQSK